MEQNKSASTVRKKASTLRESLAIPEHVTVSYASSVFTVKGKKGEVHKRILTPGVKCSVENNHVVFVVDKLTKREKKLVFTAIAHLQNLFKGVREGHVYKLKICSGHFPMTVAVKNNVLEIKNFFGEAIPRKVPYSADVTVKINAPEIVVEGIDLDKTAQTAANIEQVTRRPGFDFNRFQDGIYIVEKDGKPFM